MIPSSTPAYTILTLHTVQGLGGKESERSTAIAKQHKDENRFGNILVCKFLRIFYTKFLLWIHTHTLTPAWFPADDDNLIILDPIPGQEDCQSDYINACYVDVSVVCVWVMEIDGACLELYVASDRKESDIPIHACYNSLRWLLSLP